MTTTTGTAARPSEPNPGGVPLVIEEDWEPSLDAPLPKMRCVAVVDPHDLTARCGRWSIRGLSTCAAHAEYDQFPSVRVYADAVVESARLRLMGMADQALDAITDLLGPDTKQNVRLRAAEITLDRAGVVPPPVRKEVDVTITHNDPARVLAERLERLAAAPPAAQEVYEAEVVDEALDGAEDSGESLF